MDAPTLCRIAVFLVAFLAWASPTFAQDLSWPDQNRRVGWAEATVTGGSVAAMVGLRVAGEPDEARWIGPILVDDAFRSAMFTEGESVELTGALSDLLLMTLMGWTIAIDSIGVAGLANDEWDSAFQTSTIAAQSHALNALVTMGLKHAIGRRRPGFGPCYDDPFANEKCGARSNVSFPSGHTSTAFTGAGLVCVTHEHIGYYGGPADQIACVAALGMAATTGLLRVTSNNHYLSDIVVGAIIGFSFGYLLPRAVYFDDEPAPVETAAPALVPAPPALIEFGGTF